MVIRAGPGQRAKIRDVPDGSGTVGNNVYAYAAHVIIVVASLQYRPYTGFLKGGLQINQLMKAAPHLQGVLP